MGMREHAAARSRTRTGTADDSRPCGCGRHSKSPGRHSPCGRRRQSGPEGEKSRAPRGQCEDLRIVRGTLRAANRRQNLEDLQGERRLRRAAARYRLWHRIAETGGPGRGRAPGAVVACPAPGKPDTEAGDGQGGANSGGQEGSETASAVGLVTSGRLAALCQSSRNIIHMGVGQKIKPLRPALRAGGFAGPWGGRPWR